MSSTGTMAATWRIPAIIAGATLKPAVNVWHIVTSGNTNADAQAAVDKIRDFYTTAAIAYPTVNTIQIGVGVVDITSVPPVIPVVTTRTVNGTQTGGAAAYQLAHVVSWRTQFAGRSFRGRTYLGPLALTSVSGPNLASTANTAVNNAATALIAAGGLVVWSPKLANSTAVTGFVTNTLLETQRRRATP